MNQTADEFADLLNDVFDEFFPELTEAAGEPVQSGGSNTSCEASFPVANVVLQDLDPFPFSSGELSKPVVTTSQPFDFTFRSAPADHPGSTQHKTELQVQAADTARATSIVASVNAVRLVKQGSKSRASKQKGARSRSGTDSNKLNKQRILKLEEELAQKLSLYQDLEQKNHELKQRERLLQLSVIENERNLKCRSQGLNSNLAMLLQSFRSQLNMFQAQQILDRLVPSLMEGKQLSMDDFISTWNTLFTEMGDVLLRQSMASSQQEQEEVSQRLNELSERSLNFTMAVCVHSPQIIMRIVHVNLQTGAEATAPAEHWVAVAEQLELTQQQVADCLLAFNVFKDCLEQLTAEREQIIAQLDMLIQSDKLDQMTSMPVLQDELLRKLQAGFARSHVVYNMLSFLVLGILTPYQKCKMVFVAYPFFPAILRLLFAIVQQAQGSEASSSGSNGGGASRAAAFFKFPSVMGTAPLAGCRLDTQGLNC